MKKSIKVLALILAAIMCLGMFAACGTGTADKKDDEKAPAADNTNDTVAEENKANENENEDGNEVVEDVTYEGTYEATIKMATNAAFPPYEYKEGDKFVGIDVEIAKAIAAELGTELDIVDMEFDSIITSVQAGEVDFGMVGKTLTDERREEVEFSVSYATGVQSVIVAEGSDIKTLDDLAGKKIGVQLGTTGDIYATDDFGADFVTQYGKGADAVIALQGGDVDAVIIDNAPAQVFVSENEGLTILDTNYAVEDYAIAIQKGNDTLLNDINKALEKLTLDGTIDSIILKYISAE